MKILYGFLVDFEDPTYYEKIDIKTRYSMIENFFVFSLYWGLGGSIIGKNRKPFCLFVKRLLSLDEPMPKEVQTKKLSLPERGTMYEYLYQTKYTKDVVVKADFKEK